MLRQICAKGSLDPNTAMAQEEKEIEEMIVVHQVLSC